jgi:hypothetical protein
MSAYDKDLMMLYMDRRDGRYVTESQVKKNAFSMSRLN